MSYTRIQLWQDDGTLERDPDWMLDERDYAAMPVLDVEHLELLEECERTYHAWAEARRAVVQVLRRDVPLTDRERAVLAARRALEAALAADDGASE